MKQIKEALTAEQWVIMRLLRLIASKHPELLFERDAKLAAGRLMTQLGWETFDRAVTAIDGG